MRRFLGVWLPLALALSGPELALLATFSASSGTAIPSSSGQMPSTAPLPAVADRATPSIDDVGTVFDSFTVAPKDEFETTAQFEARAAAAQQVARSFSVWVTDFPMPRYNADKGVLVVSVPTNSCSYVTERPNCTVRSMVIASLSALGERYSASNAFGGRVEVQPVHRVVYGLILPKPRVFALSIDIPIPATPDQARAWRDTVRLLLTIGPGAGVTQRRAWEVTTSTTATFASPYETSTQYRYLDLPVVELSVVNASDGAVLGKLEGPLN